MKKIALGIAALAVFPLILSGCALATLATSSKPSPPAVVKQGTPVTVRAEPKLTFAFTDGSKQIRDPDRELVSLAIHGLCP